MSGDGWHETTVRPSYSLRRAATAGTLVRQATLRFTYSSTVVLSLPRLAGESLPVRGCGCVAWSMDLSLPSLSSRLSVLVRIGSGSVFGEQLM